MRRMRTYKCSTCKVDFESRTKDKVFCSMRCYVRSPLGREKLLAAGLKGAAQRKKHKGSHSVHCIECERVIFTTLPERKFRFCNARCRRSYWAKLFDAMIASPEGLPLPQNYDEYLNRNELPCLMPGCDWEGRSLSGHLFQCHGIKAADFKELAGFNRSTGLVGVETSESMAKPHRGETKGNFGKDESDTPVTAPNYHPPLRLEAREHMSKARTGRKHSEETKQKIRESNKRTSRRKKG